MVQMSDIDRKNIRGGRINEGSDAYSMERIIDYISDVFSQKVWKIGLLIAAVVIVAVIFLKVRGNSSAVKEGIAYLEEQEAVDIKDVQNAVSEVAQKRASVRRAELKQQFIDGEVDVWSMFTDYVLLGDSRAEGFSAYGFLSDDRVLAEKGETILDIENHLTQIQAASPTTVILAFGMNDVIGNIGSSPEGWAKEYLKQIKSIQTVAPHADIYVNDIVAPQDTAYAEFPALMDYDVYNMALKEMCEKNGYFYVDTSETTEANPGLYEADGIHVSGAFYEQWAADIIMTMLDSGSSVMSGTQTDMTVEDDAETDDTDTDDSETDTSEEDDD